MPRTRRIFSELVLCCVLSQSLRVWADVFLAERVPLLWGDRSFFFNLWFCLQIQNGAVPAVRGVGSLQVRGQVPVCPWGTRVEALATTSQVRFSPPPPLSLSLSDLPCTCNYWMANRVFPSLSLGSDLQPRRLDRLASKELWRRFCFLCRPRLAAWLHTFTPLACVYIFIYSLYFFPAFNPISDWWDVV